MKTNSAMDFSQFKSVEDLFPLTGPQLIAAFNELQEQLGLEAPVKRFSDLVSGRRRVWNGLVELRRRAEASQLANASADAAKAAARAADRAAKAASRTEEPAIPTTASATNGKAKGAGTGKRRSKLFRYAPEPGKNRELRAGSRRALMLALMSREGGALFSEIMEKCRWNLPQATEAVRLLNKVTGHGTWGDELPGGDYRLYVVDEKRFAALAHAAEAQPAA